MRSIIAVLLLTFIGLQYKLWLGDASVLHGIYLEKKLLAQEQENEKLNVRNRTLEADILELKQGDQALEELARFELGMIKNNEVYYQFIE